MFQQKKHGKKSALFAAISLFTFLLLNLQIARAAESSCVTCHLDQEMLKKNLAVQQGKKSAMQSGAG